jgi:DNA polymerase theta
VLERVDYFNKLLGAYNRRQAGGGLQIKVRGVFGDKGMPRFCKEHILVCTIEKANQVLNSFLSATPGCGSNSVSASPGVSSVGCVVVDELHMMGDAHRGFLLEILIR